MGNLLLHSLTHLDNIKICGFASYRWQYTQKLTMDWQIFHIFLLISFFFNLWLSPYNYIFHSPWQAKWLQLGGLALFKEIQYVYTLETNLTFTNLTCLSAGLSFLKFFSITPLNALKKKPSKALICKKKNWINYIMFMHLNYSKLTKY